MSIAHTVIEYTQCHIYAVESNAIPQKFNQIETEHFGNVSQFFIFCEDVSAVSKTVTTNCAKLSLRRTFRNALTVAAVGKCLCYHVALVLSTVQICAHHGETFPTTIFHLHWDLLKYHFTGHTILQTKWTSLFGIQAPTIPDTSICRYTLPASDEEAVIKRNVPDAVTRAILKRRQPVPVPSYHSGTGMKMPHIVCLYVPDIVSNF